jgi:hypothetical protein
MEGKCQGTHSHAANTWAEAESTPPAPPAAAAVATPTRSPQEKAQANAQVTISMQANMRATGHSSEEISAALVQLFPNSRAPTVQQLTHTRPDRR